MSNRLCAAAILSAVPFVSANADIIHPDDVIIEWSTCMGVDCVDGESFGADMLRLKENNLRIHFQDTSTTFPSNDWRIIINDSTRGGQNYFAVEDSTAKNIPFMIKAGAGADAMYIGEGGKVGLGTRTPATDLHITSGQTPTLRLDQDGSQGFKPSAWNLSGNDSFFSVRDDAGGKPQKRLEPNGNLTITGQPQMRLEPNGNLTITGQLTTAPTAYPDYVFEPHYKLMPMDELKAFIDKHRHLPNVPPAEEIVENGLNLTEMNIRLIEKVEELTLYTLQQQETISALTRRLEKLEREQQKNQ